MAYHLHHIIQFDSWITEDIRIELYKKDVTPLSVTNLKAIRFRQTYPKGNGDKMDGIIASEATLTLWLRTTDTVEFYDLLVTYIDEWKMIAYSDEQVIFVGFLQPGEGTAEFQNKPYEITLNAVDALGLLKGVPLTDINGDNFEGINLIKDYFAAIFSKTGCDIPIRMFSSWVEESGAGRIGDATADTFNQYGLHKRTFLNDKTEFYDCYESLRRLCEGWLSAYQWMGMWVVRNIGEMQANAGPLLWYTDYDSSGTITGSGQLAEAACPVGHDLIIHPRDRSQYIGSDLPLKSARHNFSYIPPPELVNNQDLSQLGALISPLGGPSHRAYQIVGWTKYENDLRNETAYTGSATVPYIRVDIDAFSNEVFRYYRIGGDNTATGQITGYIRNDNDDFWVVTNDRLDISITYRVSDTLLTSRDIVIVALLIDGAIGSSASDWWTLGEDGNWQNNDTTVAIDHDPGAGTNKWLTVELEADPFPADGNVYILLGTGNMNTSQYIDYKAPNITWRPYFSDPIRTFARQNFGNVQAGIIPFVLRNPNDTAPKGDYWITEQNANILDKEEMEIFISDTNRKSIKGAIFRGTTSTLTTTTWHRDNVTEERHFKELVNMTRFNNAYRRMWKSRGVFSGLKFQPADDTTVFEPLSFHRHFFFPDKASLGGKYFMIAPPLTINHDSGMFDGTFVESIDTALVEGVAGVTAEQVAYQLAVAINLTTEAEWDSASGAPAPGTDGFPPFATVIGGDLLIYTNTADTPVASVNPGGAGNSPSITQLFTAIMGSVRLTRYTIGSDIQPGNVFNINIYGHDVSFTSTSVTAYQDGNQLGDRHEYSILFK